MEKIIPVSESPLDAYRGRHVTVRAFDLRKGKHCWKFSVICPFCKAKHKHGGGELNAPPSFGFRIADCVHRSSINKYLIIPPFFTRHPGFASVPHAPTEEEDRPDSVSLQIQKFQ